MELTLSQKYALAKKGKKLDPVKVEAAAMAKLGKGYRNKLMAALGGSNVIYVYAFQGKAPYKLWEIHQHLKSIN